MPAVITGFSPPKPTRPGLRRTRKHNRRRAPVVRRSFFAWLTAECRRGVRVAVRALLPLAKLAVAAAVLVGLVVGGRAAVRHVVGSPRFALREVVTPPLARLDRAELLTVAGVALGDRLLAIDPAGVARRLAEHPWVASVEVKRQLPSTLLIDVRERQAAATAMLSPGALYLIDPQGRPFKRATLGEAEGLAVITGIDRAQFSAARDAGEAAFREALGVLATYHEGAKRPAVSEVAIDVRAGFTLFLLETGTEVRLGRGDYIKKLARLDQILESLSAKGPHALSSLRLLLLDDARGRVVARLSDGHTAGAGAPSPAPRSGS